MPPPNSLILVSKIPQIIQSGKSFLRPSSYCVTVNLCLLPLAVSAGQRWVWKELFSPSRLRQTHTLPLSSWLLSLVLCVTHCLSTNSRCLLYIPPLNVIHTLIFWPVPLFRIPKPGEILSHFGREFVSPDRTKCRYLLLHWITKHWTAFCLTHTTVLLMEFTNVNSLSPVLALLTPSLSF